ncbi:ABC transporter permease [Nitrospinota bacterium]
MSASESKLSPAEAVGESRGPARLAKTLVSLWRRKTALFGISVLTIVVGTAVLAPWIAPMDPTEQSLPRRMKPPLWSEGGQVFILGTDHLGRDLLSRVIYGSRVSLVVGISAVVFSGGIGLAIGLLAGYCGGRVDYFLMRLVDLVLSFPLILLALACVAILGPSLPLIIVVISMRVWTIYARVVRASVLSMRETEFVLAARAIGGSDFRVVLRHILPNVVAPVIIIASLYLGQMIVIESGLSFLGLGVPPPTPTWGGLLSEGRNYIYVSWWIVTFPGLAITITVLGSNLVGDWLRDTFDPRLRTR